MIDGMFQPGTDQALNDQVVRPRPAQAPTPGFWAGFSTAAPRGVGAAANEGVAFLSELTGAFGDVMGSYPEAMSYNLTADQKRQGEIARNKLLTQGLSFNNEASDMFRSHAKDFMPDPATTGTAAQVTAGLFNFGTKAVGYTATMGPFGAFVLGGDVGMTEADRLREQGVDLETRTKAGLVAGGLAGASVVAPMGGASALTRFAKGAAVGEGTIVSQALAEKAILSHAGYDKLADTFDPLDPVSLALGIVPGLLGAKFGHAPTKLGAVKTDADLRTGVQLSSAEQARSDAFERSAGNLRELEAAVAAEKRPEQKAILQKELDTQRAAAAAVHDQPELVDAARVRQTAQALDESRLTAPDDIRGANDHLTAVELASDQIGRGERVQVDEFAPSARPVESLADFMARTKIKDEAVPPEVTGNFMSWVLSKGGISIAEKLDITGEPGGVRSNPSGIFRRGGMSTDDLALNAAHEGYLPMDMAGDSGAFVDLVKRAVSGDKVLNFSEQGQKASRDARVNSLTQRLEWVEQRLKLLGVDTTQAHGNVAALEAYAQAHEPHLLAAALDEVRRADIPPEADGLQARARVIAGDIQESARTLPQYETEIGPLSTVMRKLVGDELKAAEGKTSIAAPLGEGQDSITQAAHDVAILHPDMMVQMEGMAEPMRVGDLLEAVKREAANDAQEADLLKAAVSCALRQ